MVTVVANQKGGVGKTTTAANIGVLWAAQGRRVLLVDVDPQSALTRQLGLEVGALSTSLVDVLAGERVPPRRSAQTRTASTSSARHDGRPPRRPAQRRTPRSPEDGCSSRCRSGDLRLPVTGNRAGQAGCRRPPSCRGRRMRCRALAISPTRRQTPRPIRRDRRVPRKTLDRSGADDVPPIQARQTQPQDRPARRPAPARRGRSSSHAVHCHATCRSPPTHPIPERDRSHHRPKHPCHAAVEISITTSTHTHIPSGQSTGAGLRSSRPNGRQGARCIRRKPC